MDKNSYFVYKCKLHFQSVFILYLMLYGVDNVSLTMLMLSFFPLQLHQAVHQFHAWCKKAKRMCGLRKENPTRCNNVSKFFIPYLYEAQHISGNTPPTIRSLKLHWQPLAFHTWKVAGRVAGGCCQAQYPPVHISYTSNNLPHMKNQRLPVQF